MSKIALVLVASVRPGGRVASPKRGNEPIPQCSAKRRVVRRRRLLSDQSVVVKIPAGRATPRRPTLPGSGQPSPERYKDIQQALAGKGYFQGEIERPMGADSADALKRFQADQNLATDGKLNSLSLIALGLGPKRTLTRPKPPAPAPQPEHPKNDHRRRQRSQGPRDPGWPGSRRRERAEGSRTPRPGRDHSRRRQFHPRSRYVSAGAEIVPTAAEVWGRADLVVKVKEPQPSEYAHFRPGLMLFTYLHLAPLPELTAKLVETKVNSVAYETIREKDGSLPLLTPMSEVAGRMAVQVGAQYLEKPNGGRGVLLGGVPGVAPGNVVILGGGVVGHNCRQDGRRPGGARHHHRSEPEPVARAGRYL